MEEKNLSLKDIEVITTISDSQKTTVELVSLKGTKQLAVLKQYPNKPALGCYEQTVALHSMYFPKILQIWEENDVFFLLEEYISGVTLQEKLDGETLFTETELTTLLKQICQALLALHNAIPPIIHRDIKPENIIITTDGNVKLLDFDAAREYKEEKEHDTVLMGTKHYASPEQFGFMQTDTRSDIYSFGIVFSELLSHTNASSGYNQKAKKIIDKSTMFDPEKRYANTEQLLKDITLLEKRKKTWLPYFLVTGLVGLLFVFILFITNREPIDEATSTPDVLIEETNESEIIKPESNETKTPSNPVSVSEIETLALENVYNYVDIMDEVNPTAFYLMENNGYLFDGIPTSGFPEGMYSMNQECIIGTGYMVCRFLKEYPRDLVFCDFRLSNLVRAYIYPYIEETGENGEQINLTSNDFTQRYDNVVSISKEFLNTLEPGAYTLYMETPNFSYPLYLIVHGEGEKVDKFYPRPINEINYYSSIKQNDVVFYSTGTPYPIKEVKMNNRVLDPESYTLVDGGFGIVFKPDFLENYKDLECIEMIYVTENDREGGIRIINISNFQ